MRVLQSAAFAKPKVCVFLAHLGAPKAVDKLRPYLRDVFADALPASWPRFVRARAASWFASVRERSVAQRYEQVACNAPLWRHTEEQRACLEARLILQGYDARVLVVSRYATARLHDALLEARAHAADAHWIALPLYPQYSRATTGRCMADLHDRMSPTERERLSIVDSYADHPLYLEAMAESLEATLNKLSPAQRREVHVVFAARGALAADAVAGDPYAAQLEETIAGITHRLTRAPRHTLTYQDSSLRWRGAPVLLQRPLQPGLMETLTSLGQAGQRAVIVMPLGAATEDFDTLYGLDVEACKVAIAAGVQTYERVATVGSEPGFTDVLTELVESRIPAAAQADGPGESDVVEPPAYHEHGAGQAAL